MGSCSLISSDSLSFTAVGSGSGEAVSSSGTDVGVLFELGSSLVEELHALKTVTMHSAHAGRNAAQFFPMSLG